MLFGGGPHLSNVEPWWGISNELRTIRRSFGGSPGSHFLNELKWLYKLAHLSMLLLRSKKHF